MHRTSSSSEKEGKLSTWHKSGRNNNMCRVRHKIRWNYIWVTYIDKKTTWITINYNITHIIFILLARAEFFPSSVFAEMSAEKENMKTFKASRSIKSQHNRLTAAFGLHLASPLVIPRRLLVAALIMPWGDKNIKYSINLNKANNLWKDNGFLLASRNLRCRSGARKSFDGWFTPRQPRLYL